MPNSDFERDMTLAKLAAKDAVGHFETFAHANGVTEHAGFLGLAINTLVEAQMKVLNKHDTASADAFRELIAETIFEGCDDEAPLTGNSVDESQVLAEDLMEVIIDRCKRGEGGDIDTKKMSMMAVATLVHNLVAAGEPEDIDSFKQLLDASMMFGAIKGFAIALAEADAAPDSAAG